MKDDLNIPTFLKRTETEAQAEARRKKLTPKDTSKGLKVVTPLDPKVSAAIAKDFAEKKKGEKLETAKSAVEKINEARAKDGLRPYKPGKSDGARARAAREKAPKKAGSLVEKAIKARDEIAQKAGAKKPGQKPETAAALAIKKLANVSTKPAKKRGKERYDWTSAEEAAKKGSLPPALDFSANTHKCYRPRLAEIEKAAKAKDVKALRAMHGFRDDGSPLMMNRWRKLAITALEAKQAR